MSNRSQMETDMIDRAWNANFMAGAMFGGALSIACLVLALVVLIPIGPPEWRAFALGAVTTPLVLTAILCGVVALAWAGHG